MDALPQDLLLKTFKELDPRSLCRLAQVSKAFRVPTESDEVWLVAHGWQKTFSRTFELWLSTRVNHEAQILNELDTGVGSLTAHVSLRCAQVVDARDSMSRALDILTSQFSNVSYRALQDNIYTDHRLTAYWEIERKRFDRALRNRVIAQEALDAIVRQFKTNERLAMATRLELLVFKHSLGTPLTLRTWLAAEIQWRYAHIRWTYQATPENSSEAYRLESALYFAMGLEYFAMGLE
jgi:hypothetical protein